MREEKRELVDWRTFEPSSSVSGAGGVDAAVAAADSIIHGQGQFSPF